MGRLNDAEAFLRGCLAAQRVALGPAHPRTAAAAGALGRLRALRGDLPGATALLEESLRGTATAAAAAEVEAAGGGLGAPAVAVAVPCGADPLATAAQLGRCYLEAGDAPRAAALLAEVEIR